MAKEAKAGNGRVGVRSIDGSDVLNLSEAVDASYVEEISSDSCDGPSGLEDREEQSILDADNVVGISIGESQNHMKSPQTPAIEKSQALEQSEDYFVDALEASQPPLGQRKEIEDDTLSSNGKNEEAIGTRSNFIAAPSTSKVNYQPNTSKRPETSRSILRDTLATSRKRASSGSAIIAESLRRLVPDVSSVAWLTDNQGRSNTKSIKWATTGKSDACLNSPRENQNSPTSEAYPSPEGVGISPSVNRKTSTDKAQGTSHPDSPPLDPTLSSVKSRPLTLRRTTSDNSLFLRRQNTSSTSESGQWDHVHEQVNSRIKAIRDSLQDSSFRIPKLPNLSIGPFGPASPNKGESDSPASRKTFKPLWQPPMAMSRDIRYHNKVTREEDGVPVSAHIPSQNEPQKSNHPILADALADLHGDVIVLGGYRGSVLRSAKPPYRQLWVPVKVGLNIRRVDLEVGLNVADEEQMENNIIPSGVLSHIGPVDICRRLLRKLYKCRNAQDGKLRVHDYGYDWRLSPHILSRKLIEFLETLQCNQSSSSNSRGAFVIAHSLGGLIARHAINQRPELFAGVLYAGVPQHCVNILGPLRKGDSVLLSSKVLTAQVNFTIRTSFLLLPESGICFRDKVSKERYDVDFFDAKTWDDYRLSPCISPPFLQKPKDRPTTVIEAVSNTISGTLGSFSVPARRLSEMIGGGSSSESATSSSDPKVTDAARSIKKETTQATHAARSPPISLEPTMDGQHHLRTPTTGTTCTIPRPDAVEYLQRTLTETRRFKKELACKEQMRVQNEYPPAAVLYSRNTPTVSGARVSGREGIKYCDAYDNLIFGAGDGVVLVRAAMLPEGYRIVKDGLVKSERGHVGLLGDLEGVGSCLRALIDGRSRGIGLGEQAVC